MELQEPLLLEPLLDRVRRRALLPLWIRIFCWVFIVFGVLAIGGLLLSLGGSTYSISLYGLEATSPYTPIGGLLVSLFLLKGAVALGLWTEQDWALPLGIADAVIGIGICVFLMLLRPLLSEGFGFHIRLELLLLLPYLLKLISIRTDWNRASKGTSN